MKKKQSQTINMLPGDETTVTITLKSKKFATVKITVEDITNKYKYNELQDITINQQ